MKKSTAYLSKRGAGRLRALLSLEAGLTRPNVLLVTFDHWPAAIWRGHQSELLTPTLDQLAENGVVFERTYSCVPTCIPARRTLMTGTTAALHGDRVFNEELRMPREAPTLADTLTQSGYQAFAVGKLHVHPQRDRIGFNDAMLNEEGRRHLESVEDDYERFLRESGYGGRELTHGMGNNEYMVRPWHLPEECHPTSWTVKETCRLIQRRDPTRPAFWYCSFAAPHPPITPPQPYLELYLRKGVAEPDVATWAEVEQHLPYALRAHRHKHPHISNYETELARAGFYAQCTYIDHQLRLVIGCLREEGVLDNTIVVVTSDHGDMLGTHRMWGKPTMFEMVTRVPLIIVDTAAYRSLGYHASDDRLVGLQDIMPTILELCGVKVPSSVEGQSLLQGSRRSSIYGEHYEDARAMRMVVTDRFKLIWYPVGNRVQLFDLKSDPTELIDLADNPTLSSTKATLTEALISNLYGEDLKWLNSGVLVGEPDRHFEPRPRRGLNGQRGWR